MKAKQIKKAIKKVNKSKDEIKADIARTARIEHMKEVVRKTFPIIEKVDSIYDGQTVVNALSGFLSAHIEKKISEIKVSDCSIDLSGEPKGKIRTAIEQLVVLFKDEDAKTLSTTLESLGSTFTKFGADKFLKQPMSNVTVKDIVA